MTEDAAPQGLSRRALLLGAGVGVAAAATAGTVAWTVRGAVGSEDLDRPVEASGVHQAGVATPAVPQPTCLVMVADLDTTVLQSTLAALGGQILVVTDASAPDAALTPDGPGDLTITVGLGAEALAATGRPELADLTALPDFRGDAALPADRRGGGLLISVNASDSGILEPVMASLTALVAGFRPRWSDFGFRGPAEDGVTRNAFGYHDGIIVPRSTDELAENVWIADGPLTGGTVCVIRRFSLNTTAFRALAQERKDAVMGREQASGAPLSGGERDDEIDLRAKADNGDLLVPQRAHARAAHPSFTGSDLMLRRSYNYRASADDHGHMFISYQSEGATFARTQLRLDEVDDLMEYVTPTATGAFAILPGFSADKPLGASLF